MALTLKQISRNANAARKDVIKTVKSGAKLAAKAASKVKRTVTKRSNHDVGGGLQLPGNTRLGGTRNRSLYNPELAAKIPSKTKLAEILANSGEAHRVDPERYGDEGAYAHETLGKMVLENLRFDDVMVLSGASLPQIRDTLKLPVSNKGLHLASVVKSVAKEVANQQNLGYLLGEYSKTKNPSFMNDIRNFCSDVAPRNADDFFKDTLVQYASRHGIGEHAKAELIRAYFDRPDGQSSSRIASLQMAAAIKSGLPIGKDDVSAFLHAFDAEHPGDPDAAAMKMLETTLKAVFSSDKDALGELGLTEESDLQARLSLPDGPASSRLTRIITNAALLAAASL